MNAGLLTVMVNLAVSLGFHAIDFPYTCLIFRKCIRIVISIICIVISRILKFSTAFA